MIISHVAAVVVAILIVLCVGKFAGIIPMFNYLAAGAELGSAVKNNKLTGE
jgi:hypothetical protein